MSAKEIQLFFSEIGEGDEFYPVPVHHDDVDGKEIETGYVLSNESKVSPEMRLEILEEKAKGLFVWCESTGTYKVKKQDLMIHKLGE